MDARLPGLRLRGARPADAAPAVAAVVHGPRPRVAGRWLVPVQNFGVAGGSPERQVDDLAGAGPLRAVRAPVGYGARRRAGVGHG